MYKLWKYSTVTPNQSFLNYKRLESYKRRTLRVFKFSNSINNFETSSRRLLGTNGFKFLKGFDTQNDSIQCSDVLINPKKSQLYSSLLGYSFRTKVVFGYFSTLFFFDFKNPSTNFTSLLGLMLKWCRLSNFLPKNFSFNHLEFLDEDMLFEYTLSRCDLLNRKLTFFGENSLKNQRSKVRLDLKNSNTSFRKYTSLYGYLTSVITTGLYSKFNSLRRVLIFPVYYLYWTWTRSKNFYVTMRNSVSKNYNYFYLFTGLFLKFYGGKKPLRKSKLFKILLVKLLRKILLLTKVYNIRLVVNNMSALFLEFYKLLHTPSIVPYRVPGRRSIYNDSELNPGRRMFHVRKVIFRRTIAFAPVKLRRKGRLKRKITRRLVRKNNVMD